MQGKEIVQLSSKKTTKLFLCIQRFLFCNNLLVIIGTEIVNHK